MAKSIVVLLVMMLAIQSCKQVTDKTGSQPATAESVQTQAPQNIDIDIQAARTMMADNPDIVLLDVRTPEEIANGKIGEALEMDFTDPGFKDKVAALDKNKEYIVYCAAGGRSAKAVSLMNELGFTKAHNMLGGSTAWTQTK